MYCANCGNRLIGNEKYCPNCGNMIDDYKDNNTTVNDYEKDKNNSRKRVSIVLGIVGIIGGILVIFSPISFILSIIGLIIGIKINKNINNVTSIVLNVIGLFLSLVSLIIFTLFIFILFNINNNIDYDIWENIPNISEYSTKF